MLTSVKVVLIVLALAGLLGLAGPAHADGIIILPCPQPTPFPDQPGAPNPCPPCPPTLPPSGGPLPRCTPYPPCRPPDRCLPPFSGLAIKYHRVSVTIDKQIATTHVDQVFVNDAPVDLEGTYIFPLPEDAAVSEFAMWVDGKRLEAQVLDKDKAKQIYLNIVSQQRDPALLEYIGRGAFQARVYPIPARGEKRIELEYKQVLTSDGGLIKYIYPLNTEKFSSRPLNDVSVSVSIKSQDAIKVIYSPSHDISVSRNGDFAAVAGYEAKNVRPDRDFALYYSVSPNDIALNLLTYKPASGEDGFFVLLAAPRVETRAGEVVAKDVIFVLDVSGSMQGAKIEQAKKALEYVVGKLNPADRFNIITFSTGVNKYMNGLRPASEKDEALPFVRAVKAEGSTDINRALLEALAMVDRERPTLIIFMTDGLPTTGEVAPNKIIANAQSAAPKNVRLFTFGVGFDVNTVLLDTLAQNLRGASGYIKPNEDINEVVSAFYAKVSTPVLADLKIDFAGVIASDLYPSQLPDLFAGGQLVLAGRYRSSGPTTVRLSGTVNGRAQTFTYVDAQFAASPRSQSGASGGDEAIARIWATRKIGYLLNQIRLNGSQKELIDEVVALSVRYGIVTPYTSFLVNETERAMSEQGRSEIAAQQQKALATPAAVGGAAAVQQSQDTSRLSGAAAAPSAPTTAPIRAGTGGASSAEAIQVIKYVGDKTFVLNNGVWMDTAFDVKKMSTTKVAFQSADYYKVLDARPEWGRYFAVGARVIVVLGNTAYEVVDPSSSDQPTTPLVIPSPLPPSAATPVLSIRRGHVAAGDPRH
ncbi:MAG: VWA domain-containing protein [Chloroflexi bacterium]|nr:VWA domain-containing protein [Chloroflexota bacterium]